MGLWQCKICNEDKINMKVIIINGYPRSGKDTLVKIVSRYYNCMNYSSVDKVKEIAILMGWDGNKTPINRKMLSELKKLYIKYFDGPFNDIVSVIDNNMNKDYIFIHIREPEEIKRLKSYCKYNDIYCKTLFVDRCVETNIINNSDKNVIDMIYDMYIENDKGLIEFENNVKNLFGLL